MLPSGRIKIKIGKACKLVIFFENNFSKARRFQIDNNQFYCLQNQLNLTSVSETKSQDYRKKTRFQAEILVKIISFVLGMFIGSHLHVSFICI